MKRFNLSPKRLLAVAGAVAVGAMASMTLATAPASAWEAKIYGEGKCDTKTGKQVVTWKISNSENTAAKITGVVWGPVTSPGTLSSTDLPAKGSVTGKQELPGTAKEASLKALILWKKGEQIVDQKLVYKEIKLKGDCKPPCPKVDDVEALRGYPHCPPPCVPGTPPKDGPNIQGNHHPKPKPCPAVPEVDFEDKCDGTVVVTLSNGKKAGLPAYFVVKATGFTKATKVEPNQSIDVTVPKGAGEITVTYWIGHNKKIVKHTWTKPRNCEGPEQPKPPVITTKADCDSITFSITNPNKTASVNVKLDANGDVTTVDVAAGKTEVVTRKNATAGLVVKVTVGKETKDYPYTKPANCAGKGGGLPVTGASLGGLIAAAVALIGGGAALMFVMRRRRTATVAGE